MTALFVAELHAASSELSAITPHKTRLAAVVGLALYMQSRAAQPQQLSALEKSDVSRPLLLGSLIATKHISSKDLWQHIIQVVADAVCDNDIRNRLKFNQRSHYS